MRGLLIAVRVAVLAGCAALAFTGLGAATSHGSNAGGATADNWPMFHHDVHHTGVAADTAIGASNASTLGVDWEVQTGGTIISSPAVNYDGKLGERVVYVGTKAGVGAYDATTGNRIWFHSTGRVSSSPAVVAGVVYFGSADHYLYALNASTGALDCRFLSAGVIASSPLVVDPDGAGRVVYFGDNGLSGTDDGGNIWAVNAVDPNSATNCSLKWQYNSFVDPLTGSWSPPAFAKDANGTPVIVEGTSNPDDSIVSLNAVTGAQQWKYFAKAGDDSDVGAGPTISLPGVNGFADGVAYVGTKFGDFYALDLTTGALIWDYDARPDNVASPTGFRSTAALVGKRIYVGSSNGVYSFNAVTGARMWLTTGINAVTSPAVTGARGDQALILGDMTGKLYALSLADGSQLWTMATGSAYVYSSAAISNGTVYVGAPNGVLFALQPGGGSGGKPDTTIESPAQGSTIPNPDGPMQASGTATDDAGVAQVMVAIHNRTSGQWWNATAQAWSRVYQESPATLTDPDGTSTSWTFTFPVPYGGGSMAVEADALDTDGQRDPVAAESVFDVPGLGNPPDTTITTPVRKQIFHFPLNGDGTINHTPFYIDISGTATDPGGAHPGIAAVWVVVENIQHEEFWCGPDGCPGEPGEYWRPTYDRVAATLDSPGATSTTWSSSFLIYDHPHTYAVSAFAVDQDKNRDPLKPRARPICVLDPGDNTC